MLERLVATSMYTAEGFDGVMKKDSFIVRLIDTYFYYRVLATYSLINAMTCSTYRESV